MSQKLSCPECDSENIKIEKIQEEDCLAFGHEFDYEKELHACMDCNATGSFSQKVIEENDNKYNLALKEANKHSIESILQYLSDFDGSMARIERSLGLAQRTLSRWKTQGVSASGIALMRIIRTYPWILDVADEDFNEMYANQELIKQAAVVIYKYSKPESIDVSHNQDKLKVGLTWRNNQLQTTESSYVENNPSFSTTNSQ